MAMLHNQRVMIGHEIYRGNQTWNVLDLMILPEM